MNSTRIMFQILGKVVCASKGCGVAALSVGIFFLAIFSWVPCLWAQPAGEWKTGREFSQQLEAEVGVTWRSMPLRTALENLSRSQGVAILLDRRIDPGREIDFSVNAAPLAELLTRLTAQQGLGYCQVGDVIYVGPPETASLLATVAALRKQEEESLPIEARRELTPARESGWPALSQPRELLAAACDEAGLEGTAAEQLPHDLWPAVDLPPLRFADRATLLLAGFGLTYALEGDGQALALAPLPAEAVIELTYDRGNFGPDVITQLRESFPECEVRSRGEEIAVIGRMEDQEMIRRLLAGEPVHRRRVEDPQREYTLRVTEQPAGALMRALAQQLGMQVEFDPALGEELETRVSFEVEKVDLAELLDAALAPAGLRAEVEGDTIKVLPGN